MKILILTLALLFTGIASANIPSIDIPDRIEVATKLGDAGLTCAAFYTIYGASVKSASQEESDRAMLHAEVALELAIQMGGRTGFTEDEVNRLYMDTTADMIEQFNAIENVEDFDQAALDLSNSCYKLIDFVVTQGE